ncbi:hypothetical protein HHI36_023938 [Cryptolaemus montrouzieri]|uniref:Retrotransposon gag domain-containing protein n=1 Tax=Cryptolaemus montrouzieri TaxID=559131 RepID=A0ABD2N0W6_9CUCU
MDQETPQTVAEMVLGLSPTSVNYEPLIDLMNDPIETPNSMMRTHENVNDTNQTAMVILNRRIRSTQNFRNKAESTRRVSFPIISNETIDGGPLIKTAVESVQTDRTYERHRAQNKDRAVQTSMTSTYLSSPSIPVHKWTLSFNGTGSVTSFLEKAEHLADTRKVSRQQLFESVYKLLRDDARDWFTLRRGTIKSWVYFKDQLREAFLPYFMRKHYWRK